MSEKSDTLRDTELTREQLLEELRGLRQEIAQLRQEKADLEMILEMTTEHSDALSDELLNQKQDLEIVLEMTTEHSDGLSEELFQTAEELNDQSRISRELEAELQEAHDVQMGLMPNTPPQIEGFDIAGRCVSAKTVSGDFFDYVSLGNGSLAVVLADVSGKGMKGAMNATLSSGALHSAAKFGTSPSQMLSLLNRELYPRFQRFTNCAMAMVIIDLKSMTLQFANAGIPYPIVKQGNTVKELELNGMPLGAFELAEYEETNSISLDSGDFLILFSDGIPEAPKKDNSEQLHMETDRLMTLVKGFDADIKAEVMVDTIIADVQDFSGDTIQSDDITVVVVKVQ